MENNKKVMHDEEIRLLIREMIDSFSYRYYDKKLHRNISLPANYYEVENAEKLLKDLENKFIDNPDTKERISSLKEIVENSKKKRFTFTFKMIFVLIVLLFITGYALYNNFSNLNGKYQKEEATELYQKKSEYLNERLNYYKKNPQTKDREEQISSFEGQIKKHKEISPEQYLESENKYFKNKKVKDLLVFLYSVAIFVLYILSTRAPRFVINKRKKRLMGKKRSSFWGTLILAIWNMEEDEVPEKKSSIFDNNIGKPIYSESAIDGTVTVVGHYGGDTYSGSGGALFSLMKYSLLVVVVIIAFFALVITMPLLILYNYIVNYHYKIFDRFEKQPKKHNNQSKNSPTIVPSQIEIPTAKIINTGDFYFAKYSGDGFFYYAKIEKVLNNKYLVKYYDNYQEEVAANDVCEINFAIQYLKAFANWENKGLFYPCSVNKMHDIIIVKYEDGATEEVKEHQLRFI